MLFPEKMPMEMSILHSTNGRKYSLMVGQGGAHGSSNIVDIPEFLIAPSGIGASLILGLFSHEDSSEQSLVTHIRQTRVLHVNQPHIVVLFSNFLTNHRVAVQVLLVDMAAAVHNVARVINDIVLARPKARDHILLSGLKDLSSDRRPKKRSRRGCG
jgi:hypothetical protein